MVVIYCTLTSGLTEEKVKTPSEDAVLRAEVTTNIAFKIKADR
jgi:hypothetical protein